MSAMRIGHYNRDIADATRTAMQVAMRFALAKLAFFEARILHVCP